MNNESDPEKGPEYRPGPADGPVEQKPAGSSFGLWMAIGFWVLLLGFGTVGAQKYLEKQNEADPPLIIRSDSGTGPAIALNGTRRGHYRVQGLVNGHPVDFLVDTGATEVSIPENVAKMIGLRRGQAGYANTANGVATIYDTEIQSLTIGPLHRSNVAAHISPGLTDGDALLGMSFLRHFDLVQRGNQLQIQTP